MFMLMMLMNYIIVEFELTCYFNFLGFTMGPGWSLGVYPIK